MTAGEITAVVTAIAALAAASGSWVQIGKGQRALRVQRTIDLHRDLTSGEVGAARDRLSHLMWTWGERMAGENVCHAPLWDELMPDVLADGSRGELARYIDTAVETGANRAEPLRDLYKVLWCFERIEAGRKKRVLDDHFLSQLIAPHAVWWAELTRNLNTDDTRHVGALHSLAASLTSEGLRTWVRNDFGQAPAGRAER